MKLDEIGKRVEKGGNGDSYVTVTELVKLSKTM